MNQDESQEKVHKNGYWSYDTETGGKKGAEVRIGQREYIPSEESEQIGIGGNNSKGRKIEDSLERVARAVYAGGQRMAQK